MKRLIRPLFYTLALLGVYFASFHLFPVGAVTNNGFVVLPATPVANRVPVTNSTTPGDVTWKVVPNAALANSSVTVNGVTCTLGGSCSPSAGIAGPLYGQSDTVDNAGMGDVSGFSGNGVGTNVLPANFFTAVGQVLHIYASGTIATSGAPGALQIRVKLGTAQVVKGQFTLAANIGDTPWSLDIYLNCRATGASAAVIGNGYALLPTATTGAIFAGIIGNNNATFDGTATQAVQVSSQWNTFTTGDDFKVTNASIGQL